MTADCAVMTIVRTVMTQRRAADAPNQTKKERTFVLEQIVYKVHHMDTSVSIGVVKRTRTLWTQPGRDARREHAVAQRKTSSGGRE